MNDNTLVEQIERDLNWEYQFYRNFQKNLKGKGDPQSLNHIKRLEKNIKQVRAKAFIAGVCLED